jgi:hypothetical protein
MQINFPKSVDRTQWELVAEILAEAAQIANRGKGGRNRDQVYQDSMNGLTLQYAVAQELIEKGYNLRLAPREDKSFDFEIDGTRFDVKGIFKDSAKFFTQSSWERANALPTTIYPCYDCRGGACEYVGWAKHSDFMLSNYDGYFISISRLHK